MDKFNYLGVLIDQHLSHETDVKVAIGKEKAASWKHKELLKNNVPLRRLKRLMLQSLVFSLVRYGSECFTLTKRLKRKITSFELWCYRRILKIRWADMKTKRGNTAKDGYARPVLLDNIIKRKYHFGHISRASEVSI